ncbi:hypothetical protein GGI12_002389 [Dipsacomyces acuminosporus]|nr:hypothetical protein GGI12_002389 [Dipsacomyces acuminosporus]
MPSASGEFGAPGGFSDPGGFIIPVMPSRPAPGHRPPAPDVGGFYIPPQGNYGGSFHPSSGSSGPGYPPAPNSGFHPTSWPGAYPQNTGPGGFVALGHHLGPGNFGYNNSGAPPPQPYMSSSNYNNQQRPRPIGPAPSMYQPKN